MCSTYTSGISPKDFFNIIYVVGIAHHITCNFASEFSINFLYIDAYDNSLPDWSSHVEFGNTFADFFMNQIVIIRSQFKQSSFYTLPSQKCANVIQCRPISDKKHLRDTEQHEENHMSCISVQNTLFMAFIGVVLRTWIQILQKSLFNSSFLQLWKKLLSGCSSRLVNCIGNSKIIHPSVIYFSSPNAL